MKTNMAKRTLVTAEELRRVLEYVPETGEFIRRIGTYKFRAGSLAGHTDIRGRRWVTVNYKRYFAHRLAWLYVTGKWPSPEIDHIDRDPSNNRLSNLREATRAQNQANRVLSRKTKSGVLGVFRRADDKAWVARCRINKKITYLGSFATVSEAGAAYRAARFSESGEFARFE